MYLPDLETMRVVDEIVVGDFLCYVCTDCVSRTPIDYKHVLFVQRASDKQTVFAVAAETNQAAAHGAAILARLRAEGADPEVLEASAALVGSHYLGVFPGDGHRNMGASDDWADLDKFTARALEIVRKAFEGPAASSRAPRA